MRSDAKIAFLLIATLMAIAFILVPVLAISATPDAQTQKAYIEGYVMDSASGAGLPGVTIQIDETSVKTNLTGYFRIDVAPGDHSLKASSIRHRSFSATLSVAEGDNAIIIRLNPIISEFGDTC